MSEKIYCGSGKEKQFENGGSQITVTLNMDELEKYFSDYGFVTNTGKKTIKVKIGKRREAGQYGETHTVEIDTFKPSPSSGEQKTKRQEAKDGFQQTARTGKPDDCIPPDFPDDIPF